MKPVKKILCFSAVLFSFFLFDAFEAAAQTGKKISPDAEAYLETALDIMEKNSLLKREVDWPALRRKTFEKAAGAQSPLETWDAIRLALKEIGDGHSFLQLPKELREKEDALRKTAKPETPPAEIKLPSPYIPRRRPEGFLEKSGGCAVGRVVVPLYPKQKGDDFATALNKLIAEYDGQSVCGWIVDLRGNAGGNIFPMLAGIGALLDEGDTNFALDAEGRKTAFFYKDGQSGLREPGGKETVVTKITGAAYRVKKRLPVAVLIDKGTASSGEGIAIAFRGRKNTRFFGTRTMGVSTSNEGFLLSDGANIVLTTGVGMDKNGRKYFSGIAPDVEAAGGETVLPADEDPVIKAALAWIGGRKIR